MSLTKATDQPRAPKCNRCRHHGIITGLKGHTKQCPFLRCGCWKCRLITERTRIAALQRSLRAPNHEKRPAGEWTPGVTALDGGGPQPATREPSYVAPEQTATSTCCPIDLRSRPAAGGENAAAKDSGELPLAPRSYTPLDRPYCGEFGQTAPLPVIHCPRSYVPYPNFPFNVPWSPPVSACLYNNSLYRPQTIPYFHSGAPVYPAPPQPGSFAVSGLREGLRPARLTEALQEDLTSVQQQTRGEAWRKTIEGLDSKN